ncbi:MAG TPA: dehydrogenase, partial [Clostridiaceae bacterium]|nr:dehydrogenase [Clostridiaceae bacterium]
MKISIIGAVAAGTSAAAKARRNHEEAEIILYDKDEHISYSGCGMPYFLGGEVDKGEDLTPRDPAFFKSKYNVTVKIRHEVLSVDPVQKEMLVKNLDTGEVFKDHYDKLVLSTGASAVKPPIQGVDQEGVFVLRTIKDMYTIEGFLKEKNPQRAVIIGTGFIGLEMAENLKHRGLSVTMVEMLPQVSPGLDEDMAMLVEEHLEKHGVKVHTGVLAKEILDTEVVLSSGERLSYDLVLLSTGVRPNTALAKDMGLTLGETGAIVVTPYMETSEKDVYAAGDCVETFHLITKKPVYRPLGSTANKTGRIAGNNSTGGALAFRGILGTGIYKIFDLTVGQTGLSEKEARKEGYEVSVSINIKPNKPEYLGGKEMVIKSVADKKDGRLLGVQIIGPEGVDKRLDVFATLLTYGAKVEDLFHLDLGYAPPFSTTKDPVLYTGMIQENAIHGQRPLVRSEDLEAFKASGKKIQIIDARVQKQFEKAHVEG